MRDLTGRGRDDLGTTLVETLVTMIVLSLVVGLSAAVTASIGRDTAATSGFASSVGEGRLALGTLERQVRSADVVHDPADEPARAAGCTSTAAGSGTCLRVFTQVDGRRRCVQWQVLPDGATGRRLLRTRSFSPTWAGDGDVTSWRVVARNLAASGPQPFVRPTSGMYGSRLLDVTLTVADLRRAGRVSTLSSSLTGRNAAANDDALTCLTGPA